MSDHGMYRRIVELGTEKRELIEALRVAYRSLGVAAIRDDADRRASALDVIRAAILKAEGRES